MPTYKYRIDGFSELPLPEDYRDHREWIEQAFMTAANFDGVIPSSTELDGNVVAFTFVNDMAGDALRDLDKAVRENWSTRGDLLQQYMGDAVADLSDGETLFYERVK